MLLVYERGSASRLISMVLGQDKEISAASSFERSALIEMGNILLNSAIGAIAKALELTLKVLLPELVEPSKDVIRSVLAVPGSASANTVGLLAQCRMALSGTDVSAHVAFVMDGATARAMVHRLEASWGR